MIAIGVPWAVGHIAELVALATALGLHRTVGPVGAMAAASWPARVLYMTFWERAS